MCGGSPRRFVVVICLCFLKCFFRCRGDYTGEIKCSTLVLPSMNRFCCLMLTIKRLFRCRGDYKGEEIFIHSFSPL